MVERRVSISVSEAIERVMEKAVVGAVEVVPIRESYGRYLGEDLIADHDVPLFDRSIVDGYALRSVDTGDGAVMLNVIEAIGAGTVASHRVGEKEAVRIMTGAPLPEGSDAVVMLEDVSYQNGRIVVTRPLHRDENVAKCGEDIKKGTVLLKAGRKIGAGEIALLATFGYSDVRVYKRPLVALIATGSELVDVDEPIAPGKIRNSNSYMLEAQIKQIGAIPTYEGILRDDFDESYRAVASALERVDYVITTGGVSVGDFDYIPAILKKLGAEVLFNKVEMRPGSVTTVGYKDGKWIFGLSGNPAACFVGFELFVRPLLKTYMGAVVPHLPMIEATLTEDVGRKNEYARFIRARITTENGNVYVTPVGLEKSGIVSSLAEANGLLYVPPQTEKLKKGERVTVIRLQTIDDFF